MFRAVPSVVDLAMAVRAHHLVGPCENMQVSVLQIHDRCAPRGAVKCGHFHPDRGVTSLQIFDPLRRMARADDGSTCGDGTGRVCSQKILRDQAALLVHLDDSNDKVHPTQQLNNTWPVACDPLAQHDRPVPDEL